MMGKRIKRKWEPRELRLVSEFCEQNFPEYRYILRFRLGEIPPELVYPGLTPEEIRLIGVWRRWADAVVITPTKIIIIEAAIKPDPGDISRLELYERLVPFTPELVEVRELPVEKWLVFAIEDPAITAMAEERGIVCVRYRPKWIEAYLQTLFPRERESVGPGKEAFSRKYEEH